jgi:hypothetical protein
MELNTDTGEVEVAGVVRYDGHRLVVDPPSLSWVLEDVRDRPSGEVVNSDAEPERGARTALCKYPRFLLLGDSSC